MKKRGTILWIVLALVVVAGGIIAVNPPSRNALMAMFHGEGSYKGKNTSEWLTALGDKDQKKRERAVRELNYAGPEGGDPVPVLLAGLKDKDENVRFSSATALAGLGKDAKKAVPDLLAALKDSSEKVRGQAANALTFMDLDPKQLIPAVTPLLKDPDAATRVQAAVCLNSLGDQGKDALPPLLEAFKKEDNTAVKNHLARALYGIDSEFAKNESVPAPKEKRLRAPRGGG